MVTPARALVSEEEFMSLPETNRRIELVDGEVIMAPSPTIWHQATLGTMHVELQAWAAAQRSSAMVLLAPLDIRMAPGRILQPDVCVFLKGLPPNTDMPIARIPDLCVEVLSSNHSYDRVTKLQIYAEAGVREYWMVDPAGQVERRHGAKLDEVDAVTTTLTTPLLPGLSLDVAALFA